MNKKLNQHLLDNMSKDLENWKGPFYYNRKDPRLIVPKFNPMLGWTFNFASPYSFLALIAIALIIIAIIIFK